MMKIKRSWLLATTTGIALFMILYTVIRHFTGFSFGETFEKYFFDAIFIAAIGLFILNRKIASDEQKERDAKRAEDMANTISDGSDGNNDSVGSDDITVVKSESTEE